MKKLAIFAAILLCYGAYAQQKTENVFLISIDGLRWQEMFNGADSSLLNDIAFTKAKTKKELESEFWNNSSATRRKQLLPFFWNTVAKKGQIYGNRDKQNLMNTTNKHWFSYPGYSEILCGFADDKRINSNDKINNPNTTVLEWVNQQKGFEGKVAAFGSWDVFPYIINEKRAGILVNAGFESAKGNDLNEKEKFLNQLQKEIPSPWHSVRLDAFTQNYAIEYVKKKHPRFLYIAYGETDDFAHDGKYDEYLKAAHRTDKFIQQLWNIVQEDPQYAGKTTFIITTDHGRGTTPKESWKSHGNNLKYMGAIYKIKGSDQIWMAVLGPDTPAKGEMISKTQLYQNQIAKTAAQFLGLNYINTPTPGNIITTTFR